MKYYIFFLLFFLIACDSTSIRGKSGECLKKKWGDDKYIILQNENRKLTIKNLKTSEIREIVGFYDGWVPVDCP